MLAQLIALSSRCGTTALLPIAPKLTACVRSLSARYSEREAGIRAEDLDHRRVARQPVDLADDRAEDVTGPKFLLVLQPRLGVGEHQLAVMDASVDRRAELGIDRDVVDPAEEDAVDSSLSTPTPS